jgi:hypothetical protein
VLGLQNVLHKMAVQVAQTIKQCGTQGNLSLKVHRDYSGALLAAANADIFEVQTRMPWVLGATGGAQRRRWCAGAAL